MMVFNFYGTTSGVRLCWELEKPRGPKGVYPGSSPVVYLVMQTRNLEYGGRRCGFNTKHGSIKAPGDRCGPKKSMAKGPKGWPFYRTISGVRLCWELEEPKGPKGPALP